MRIGNVGPLKTRFWMVYGEGGHGPTYKHDSRLSAETEAARLAKTNPGTAFYALKAVSGALSPRSEVKVFALKSASALPDDDDGIPF